MRVMKTQENQSSKQSRELQQKKFETLSKKIAAINSKSIHTDLKRHIADSLKKRLPEYQFDESESSRSSKNTTDKKFFVGSTQDYIPLKNIQDGMFLTKDNRYVGVVEILPIGFFQKNNIAKLSVLSSFKEVFQNKHFRWMLKIMHDTGDSTKLILNIRRNCPDQTNDKIRKSLDAYIDFLQRLPTQGAIAERFFYVWEYSGVDGIKSRDAEQIAQDMENNRQAIIRSIESCGNICLKYDNEDLSLAEFAYTFFNRKSSKDIPIYERYERLSHDFSKFTEIAGIEKEINYCDIIAPKGFSTLNRNYLVMDGTYYGFIGFSSESWVSGNVPPAWINCFNYGANVDIDIVAKLLPHDLTILALQNMNGFTKSFANVAYRKGNSEKGAKRASKYNDVNDILTHMNSGDDLYDIAIILTVRSDSPKNLRNMIRIINHDMKHKYRIEPDSCYTCCEDYLRLTMPFLYLPNVFNRLKHNIVSSKLSTLYPFTSLTINNPSGVVLGLTETRSVLCPDPFDTSYYENANMAIIGTSGAGKTFLEQLIAERAFLNGRRCFFILPVKGYEYKNSCELTDGTYIKLMPGSKDCINILEIRPESEIDRSKIEDDTFITNESLLAKKITNIILWLQLLVRHEFSINLYGQLDNLLSVMYADFGITNDNNSIYRNLTTSELKTMPILSDLFDRLPENEIFDEVKEALSPFISGTCKNLNGQTNVDLSNPFIAFDCDETVVGKKRLPAFLYIGFEFVCSIVKSSIDTKDLVFLDEVWKMLENADCAQQVQELVKLIRGYGGGTVIATQEIQDFLKKMPDFGESVLSNSSMSVVLKVKSKDLPFVKENYLLSPEESSKILKFNRGNGMFISGSEKIPFEIVPSKLELNALSDRTAKK